MESWEEDSRINIAEPTKEEIKTVLKALEIDNIPPRKKPKGRSGNIWKNIIPTF
jgi:hypothetical protein